METTKVGEIKMRSPSGHPTRIAVDVTDDGTVGIHINRTSEGEVLILLPADVTKQLSDLLAKASS